MNEFNFCPNCGKKNIKYIDGKKWLCPDCGFDLYNNVASAVGIIIYDDNGNVLFEKRAKNPRKDFLALPGGFCDNDERAEDAVVRECKEEIGFAPENIKFICTFPNRYEYKNILYKTCDIFFTSKVPGKIKSVENLIKRLSAQESEVKGFSSFKVNSTKDIEKIPLAFESAKKTLTLWLSERKIKQSEMKSEK